MQNSFVKQPKNRLTENILEPRRFRICTPEGNLTQNTIPDAVLIQFDLLMISTELLETCRGL